MSYFVRFLFAGVINSILGYLIIFLLMYQANMSPELSNFLGYGAGLFVSFFLNKKFTFKSNRKHLNEFYRFLFVFCVAYTCNFFLLVILTRHYGIDRGLSQLIAGAMYISTSFFMNKYYVFRIHHTNGKHQGIK